MAEVVWTEPALSDLGAIAEYIALDQLSAAQKLVSSVFERVDLLEKSPKSGRKPPELSDFRYQEVIVKPCRIFYRYTDDKVYVLCVMRSERELRKYILSDRESSRDS